MNSNPEDPELKLADGASSGGSGVHGLRRRFHHHRDKSPGAATTDSATEHSVWLDTADPLPFAGRVGANLAYTNCNVHSEILKKTPDAAKLTSLRQVVDVYGFAEPIYIKAAMIELFGTLTQVWAAGMMDNAFAAMGPKSSPLAINCAVAVTTWATITLWLLAAGPASGGHINPYITMVTFTCGLCTLPRALYYIIGQSIGAQAGAWFLKLGLGGVHYYPGGVIGGCTINTQLVTLNQAFVLELGCYVVVGFLAIGVGLDPRQGHLLGPIVAPILVGLVVALGSYGTGAVMPGWSGVSLNPARCFGLLAAKRTLSHHWLHWLAAITSSTIIGMVYNAIPPNYKGLALQRKGHHHPVREHARCAIHGHSHQ